MVNNKVDKLIHKKNAANQSFNQNGKIKQLFQVFWAIQNMLLSGIVNSKQ